MLSKKNFTNGQKVYELEGDQLTYFYRNGVLKAQGPYKNDLMEGEWKFYRDTGLLWSIGNFNRGIKHGLSIRYDKNDQLTYLETFKDNKIVKK